MSDLFYGLRLDTSCYCGSTVLFRGSAFDVNRGALDWIRPAILAAGSVHPALFQCLSFPFSRFFYSFLATTPTVMVFFRHGLAFRGVRRVRDLSSLHFSFLPIIHFIRFSGYASMLGMDVQ